MKLKKKIKPCESKSEKIIFPGEVVEQLSLYGKYYEITYKEPIDFNALIIEMVNAFMGSDRDFKKFLLEIENKS